MRWLACLALLSSVALGQDVFVGGRIDLELQLGGETRFDFGRLAGLDLTFSQPDVLDAYLDIAVAGGDVRLQEGYLSLPQTRRLCDVVAGRFLAPFGDSRTEREDRYAVGARDLYDPYGGWRRGNVYLDADLTGLWLRREFGMVSMDSAVGTTPDSEAIAWCGRVEAGDGVRGGGSLFFGRDRLEQSLTLAAGHLGYQGDRLEAIAQAFVGEASGGDLRGWLYRAEYLLPGAPVKLQVSQTVYNDDAAAPVTTTRLGATGRLGDYYRAEARYEWRDAPGAAGDDCLLFRLLAVF